MTEQETPDPAEQEQSGEPERPEWLPANFKAPEDLAKSYGELQNKLREQGEEKNNLEAQLTDLYGRVEEMEKGAQRAAYDPSQDPVLAAYEQAMEAGDYRAALAIQTGLMQNIAQQAQPQPKKEEDKDYEAWAFIAEQTALQEVGAEEWAQYKDRVAEEAQSENFDGLTAPQAGKRLVRLYKMLKADDVLADTQSSEEQRAEAERQAKIQAQTMTGASGRPPEPTRDEAEIARIVDAAKSGTYERLISG